VLDLLFVNFSDLKSIPAAPGYVSPVTYHTFYSIHVNNDLNDEFGYRNFAAGNQTLLHKILSTCDSSGVYELSVDAAAASLSAAVRNSMEQASLVL
jgi:hypothetical protein